MFTHHPSHTNDSLVFTNWLLLSLSAGAINAGGFLATGRFVSHVTGFATLFGVDIVHHQIAAAFSVLSVPVFFLLGCIIAGLLIDRPIYQNKAPHFDWVMGMSALCLLISAAGGSIFHFDAFMSNNDIYHVYFLLVLLCLACGLQNAAIASSSGGSIRTTHLTGLTTDLGLGIARIVTLKHEGKLYESEKRATILRFGSIISFITGSTIGAWIFIKVGYLGFIFPGIISAHAAWQGRRVKVYTHVIRMPDKDSK